MRCPNCNQEVSPGEAFCMHCGAKIPQVSTGGSPQQEPVRQSPGFLRPLYLVPAITVLFSAVVILLSIFVFPVPQDADQREKLKSQLDLGNQYVQEANYEAAVVAFNEALRIDGDSQEAELGLAEAYTHQGDQERALESLNRYNEQDNRTRQNDDRFQRLVEQNNAQVVTSDSRTSRTLVVPVTAALSRESDSGSNQGNQPEENREVAKLDPTPTPPTDFRDVVPVDDPRRVGDSPDSDESPQVGGQDDSAEERDSEDDPVGDQDVDSPQEDTSDEGGEFSNWNEDEYFYQDPNGGETEVADTDPVDFTRDSEEPSEIPENGSEAEEPMEEPDEVSADPMLLLTEYANQMLAGENLSPASVSFGAENTLNRRLLNTCQDFSGDGSPELLSLFLQEGRLSFEFYHCEGGTVVPCGSGSVKTGFSALPDGYSYQGMQECFAYDGHLGLAVFYKNQKDEWGEPSLMIELSLFSIQPDGSVTSAAQTVTYQGCWEADAFLGQMSQVGLSGTWINEVEQALETRELAYQEMVEAENAAAMEEGREGNPIYWDDDYSSTPNPIAQGLGTRESVRDLLRVDAEASAGSTSLNLLFSS